MSFDPCNHSLKIWESIGISIPQVGAHLGMCWECGGSFPHTFPHSQEHEMWLLASLLARTFASPNLGREPKVRVATTPLLSPLEKTFSPQMWWLVFPFYIIHKKMEYINNKRTFYIDCIHIFSNIISNMVFDSYCVHLRSCASLGASAWLFAHLVIPSFIWLQMFFLCIVH